MRDIEEMINQEVVVLANGVRYTGVLVEVSDEEVHLKNAMQWITLPTSSVGEIRLKKEEKAAVLARYEEGEKREA